MNDIELFKQIKKNFVSNPETFILFRGENPSNKGGLHFTTDKDWAKHFGKIILEGSFPPGSKIKHLTRDDVRNGLNANILLEDFFWFSFFAQGYDAILGTDFMDSSKLDIIVNPKHLGNFKPSNNVKWWE